MPFSKLIPVSCVSNSASRQLRFFAFCVSGLILTQTTQSQVLHVTPKAPVQVDVQMPLMRYVPGLQEPLVPTKHTTSKENSALDAATAAYIAAPLRAGENSDFADYAKPLTAYIAAHPGSGWNAALLTNLGIGYYHAGYFSRAFAAWQQAWDLGRDADSPQARMMVDRAVGELARMHARVGHEKELEAIFTDMGKRPIGGPATEMLTGAHEGLWTFHHNPGIAFLCGPRALKNLLIAQKADPKQIQIAEDARSGPHGFSLQQLAALADNAGFKYRIIYRAPGQPIPVPSIINWNVHHYAAIIGIRDGIYNIQDPTFGSTGGLAVTKAAIDAEGSGYFMVPEDIMAANLDSGWRTVDANSNESRAVYGMGTTTSSNNGGTTPTDPKTCNPPNPPTSNAPHDPMCTVNAHTMVVSLNLTDTPVGYRPQKGPSAYESLTYNQREAEQPANFGFSNVSPKWNHSWMVFVQDDPTPNREGWNVMRYASGGGGFEYYNVYSRTVGTWPSETYDNSQLFRFPVLGPATRYERHLPDGSKEIYSRFDGATTYPRKVFLTQVVDSAGNSTTLTYDSQLRLSYVTDAMGRKTTFTYGLANAPMLITRITDAFGRFTQLVYNSEGQLTSITDPIGITSSFTYSAGETTFISSMTTPYGTSHFSDTDNPNDPLEYNTRSLSMTDPLGATDYLYFYQDPSITPATDAASTIPAGINNDNTILQWRNTYYWDRYASTLGITKNSAGTVIKEDFTKAELFHWLHDYFMGLYVTSRALGSVKKPLENRVWFNYPNSLQPPPQTGYYYWSGTLDQPSATGRVLDDGTSQVSRATYNSFGLPLSKVDASGRTTTFTYAANNIDLLTVEQLTDAPSTYTTVTTLGDYNTLHEPQTYTGADGQTWQYAYNAAGQITSVTDPLKKTTTYKRDTLGRLTSIVNANNVTALTLTYDAADRISTRTDSEGYTLTYTYDNIDRVTKILYPDGTTDLYDYTFQSGSLAGKPSLDLRKHTDRLGRVTTYGYDADRRLVSVTEPLEGTVTRTTKYAYYPNGVLKDIIDANGNDTHWDIDIESRPISKTYAFGTSEAKTETYEYEATTSRLKSVTDALGQVKTYRYAIDNRPEGTTYTHAVNATPDVSLAWDPYFPRLTAMTDGTGKTEYSYTPIDDLGALKLSSIAGPFKNDTIGLTYDALGRPSERNIPGGNESFGYDAISRMTSHAGPLGTFAYSYLGQTGQTTSRKVTNGKVTVSTSWIYDSNTNDRRLIGINNSGVSRSYTLSYLIPNDGTKENPYDIMNIKDVAAAGHPFATQNHAYGYDAVDRLLNATAATPGESTYVYDPLDNIKTLTNSGEASSATYNSLNEMATFGSKSYDYDASGDTLSGDGTHTYKWDAENRLIEIDFVGSTQKSQFSYDGSGHRVIDTETTANGTVTTARYVWCGYRICQTRNASDVVLRRDLDEGEFNIGTGQMLVYMSDQLGSVRDALDASNGARVESEDFWANGAIDRSNGSKPTDYQYAGLFYHSESALNLAEYRAIDGQNSRWLNRDPAGYRPGTNLYSYVQGNPILLTDLEGLWGAGAMFSGSVEGGFGVGGAGNVFGGAGRFWGGPEGVNWGGFGGAGGFVGGPDHALQYPQYPEGQNTDIVGGGFAGAGGGAFFTNACAAGQLRGPFDTYSFNLGIGPIQFSVQFGFSGNIWIFSVTTGPGIGVSSSSYPTKTWATGP